MLRFQRSTADRTRIWPRPMSPQLDEPSEWDRINTSFARSTPPYQCELHGSLRRPQQQRSAGLGGVRRQSSSGWVYQFDDEFTSFNGNANGTNGWKTQYNFGRTNNAPPGS